MTDEGHQLRVRERYPARVIVVELRDDVEAGYGYEPAPGIFVHYTQGEDGRRIPAWVEIARNSVLVEMERREASAQWTW